MKYINGLNALRGIAVLLVIRQHWIPYGFKSYPILSFISLKILPSGTFGVDLFFVLSGFLISNILIKSKEVSKFNFKFSIIKNFIARRSLRIFPIYFLCLLLLYIFNFPDVRRYILYFATYTSNFLIFNKLSWGSLAHVWTLAVEEQFYLVWPFIIIFTPNKYLLAVIISFIFFSTASNIITFQKYGYFATVLTFNCFCAFAIGSLYSHALHNKSGASIKRTLFYLLPLAFILYVLYEADIQTLPPRLINSIISINLIIFIAEERYGGGISAIINNKLLNNLGKISYGVYLYHYIVPTYYKMGLFYAERKFNIFNKPGSIMNQPYVIDVFQFLILILISYLSYYLIESKILKLKRYFEYNYSKQ